MKTAKLVTGLLLAIVALTALSLMPMPVPREAIITPYKGKNVYILSEPVMAYKTLGTVKKTGIVMSNDCKTMVNTLLKKAVNEYPEADGIIIDDLSIETATVIKF